MRFVLTLAVAVTCAALTLAINGALAQSATAASSEPPAARIPHRPYFRMTPTS